MRKSRASEQAIIAALKDAESGVKVEDICRKLGVAQTTFYRWKAKYAGLEASEAKRLKALEEENSRLKRMVAEQALSLQALQDVVRKKW